MSATATTVHSLARRRLLGAATFSLLGASGMALAAPASVPDGWQGATLHQALQRDLVSAITGQHYRIFVSIPPGPAPAAGHPVLFALDGNASFPTLSLMARFTGRRAGAAAPVIVVGIGYVGDQDYHLARGRDYTPASGAPGDQTGKTGGVDLFLDFIERELRPMIAALAPLDPGRQALYGHSFGGLCTLHALFTRPAMFQTWLAASPSIWYGDRVVLKELPAFAKRVAALPARPGLMLTAGALEQPAPSATPFTGRDAIAAERRMIDAARELAERLQKDNTLAHVQFHLLANDNHFSASFPAMARGLEFFLA